MNKKNIFSFIFATCLLTFANDSLFAKTVGEKLDSGIEDVKHGAHKLKKKGNKKFKQGKKKVNHFFKNH